MRKIEYEIYVERDISFVFEHIFRSDVYHMWTQRFEPTAHYEGEIKHGSKIKFVDSNNSGIGGMVSEVIKNERVTFSLSYELENGNMKYLKEPGTESYHFAATAGNNTVITVYMNYQDDYYDMMLDLSKIVAVEIKKALEALPKEK